MVELCFDNSSLSDFFGREHDSIWNDLFCWDGLAEPLCYAKFSGDSDIGGYGVMASFLFFALITMILAVVEYFTDPRSRLESLQDWAKGQHPGPQAMKPPPAHLFCRYMLAPLCDLQILTGIGIVIAGFTRLKELTFYHQVLICDYWWLTLQSLWAAQVPSGSLLTMNHKSRQWATAITVLMYTIYQSLSFYQQYYEWDMFEPGKCYRSTYTLSFASCWLWVGGICIFTICLFCELLSASGARKMGEYSEDIWNFELRMIRNVRKLFSYQTLTSPASLLELIGASVALLLVFSLRQFLAIWAFGDPTFLSLLAYIGFFGWNVVDVIIMKVANRDLLLESQAETWGFGQTLPLVLAGSVIFMAADAARRL